MEKRVITVTATATEKYRADTVTVSVTATGEGKKHSDATLRAEALASETVKAAKAKGFDVRSLGVNVFAVREDKKVLGYRASMSYAFRFEYDAQRIGDALELLSSCPCEWNMAYSLKDKNPSAALLEKAVSSARENAQAIAKAAGVKLGALSSAEYSSGGGHPMFLRACAADNGAVGEPADMTVSETVTCAWEIE